MKFRHFISFLFLAAGFAISPRLSPAQQIAEPFAPGETLTYSVSWSIFHAGEVTATLARVPDSPRDSYAVDTTARSQGFVSLLFDVHDQYRAQFDPKTLCSYRISKQIDEGRRHKRTRIVFDGAKGLALLDESDPTKPEVPPKHAESHIPSCVEDIVTAFYYLRRQPFEVGKSIHFPVNDGSKTYDVEAQVQAREMIHTALGDREAFRVEPHVFSGLLKRKGQMLIWFSDDAQHFPLRIKAMISVGTITGDLISIKSLPVIGPSPAR
jgi:Protein of unknown function (DUF3108)